ncbi:MAG: hypothetical protein JO166_19070 [Deltaproteobacteria bacterium]|nr:hypothetical protein [Deltaproteobacteria bacterium]
MSNPTGSAYLNAALNYVWADGDVYEIPQSDTVEAAGVGASFGGLGVANQPHQMLLNKIQFVRNRQLQDEATLANLATMLNTISSDVGPNGWLKVGSTDQVLGGIQLLWQWGTVSLLSYGYPNNGNLPLTLPFNFPIPYPHAVWMVTPYWLTVNPNQLMQVYAQDGRDCMYMIGVETPYNLQGNNFVYSFEPDDAQNKMYSTQVLTKFPNAYAGIVGIGYAALGY